MSDISSQNDLSKYGWSFGTYPKSCPKCPEDNEFLGDKDSYLCCNHATEIKESSVVQEELNVNIGLFTKDDPEPIFTNNVSVLKR
jgi:hypothetical protein